MAIIPIVVQIVGVPRKLWWWLSLLYSRRLILLAVRVRLRYKFLTLWPLQYLFISKMLGLFLAESWRRKNLLLDAGLQDLLLLEHQLLLHLLQHEHLVFYYLLLVDFLLCWLLLVAVLTFIAILRCTSRFLVDRSCTSGFLIDWVSLLCASGLLVNGCTLLSNRW